MQSFTWTVISGSENYPKNIDRSKNVYKLVHLGSRVGRLKIGMKFEWAALETDVKKIHAEVQ